MNQFTFFGRKCWKFKGGSGRAATFLMEESKSFFRGVIFSAVAFFATNALAGDADINLPDLQQPGVSFLGGNLGAHAILYFGLVVCVSSARCSEFFNTNKPARCRCIN